MDTSFAENLLSRAREEFKKLEAQAKDTDKRKELAQSLSREAKLKYKQARKWARQTKKLLKKAKVEAEEKFEVLQKAMARLKKVEAQAVRDWKKTSAKPKAAVKAKPVKPTVTAKPATPTKPAKPAPIPKPVTKKKRAKPAKKPSLTVLPTPPTVIHENEATASADSGAPATPPTL